MEENKVKPEKTPEEKKKENKNAAIGCSFIIIIITLIVWAFYPKGDKALSIEAYSTAKVYVAEKLKSPATAKFPDYSKNFVKIIGKDSIRINAYVDSQNGFGAIVRSKFFIEMHKKGDDWYCDFFTIE
jgi:hypothetical protein